MKGPRMLTTGAMTAPLRTSPVETCPTLKAWGLTKSFGTGDVMTVALRDVAIELYPGQLALLMGPSGSGKSTLLAALSGLLRPDSGRVLALDQDLWAMNEKQREQFRRQ